VEIHEALDAHSLDLIYSSRKRRGPNKDGEVRAEPQDASAARLAGVYLPALYGKDIAMIFQESMTSLNPVLTIGGQIGGVLNADLRRKTRGSLSEEKHQNVPTRRTKGSIGLSFACQRAGVRGKSSWP
jgi:ABC-type dipeptide/oligopeptide/nickel transport system ATPase component